MGRLAQRCLQAVLAPASDPRTIVGGDEPAAASGLAGLERQQALLTQVRRALHATEAARQRLSARRASLEAMAQTTPIRDQLAEVTRAEERLDGLAQRLEGQLQTLQSRHEVLTARLAAAQAQAQANEALGDLTEELAEIGLAAAQAERVTEELESRLQAMDDVEASLAAGSEV